MDANLPELPGRLAALQERFEIRRELGRGAVGAVYHALDRQLGDEVALKVLIGSNVKQVTQVRFEREAELTRRLDHPGVVRLHDAGVIGDVPFVAYELVEGARTLADAFPLAQLRRRVELLRDAARGLGAAHALGIVHRDVKPENLLIDLAGQVRVSDFGLATAEELNRLTLTGRTVGTPYYMAPEQVRGERVGPPCDVWALGVLLYQALTDRVPFDGTSMAELSEAIVAARPRRPTELVPEVPALLEGICLRALSADPAKRFADGDAMADALDDFLGASGSRPAAQVTAPAKATMPLGPAALVGVVVVGVAVAAFATRTPAEPPATVATSTETPAPSPSAVAPGTPTPTPTAQVDDDVAKAAAAGKPWALRRRGEQLQASDPAEAVRLLKRAANAGDDEAFVILGRLLRKKGPARDLKAARSWLELAAKRNLAAGKVELGLMFQSGETGERDDRRAMELFSQAAAQGDAQAHYEVGWCFQFGRGVGRDRKEAVAWYRRGAEKGSMQAMVSLGRALEMGRDVPRDYAGALRWYRKAVELGSAPAMTNLGVMHEYGRGTEVDMTKAVEWYRKGAAAGSRVAMTNLGLLYRYGKLKQDLPRALEWFRRAEKHGFPRARVQLGKCYRDGVGVPKDLERAATLFRKAAESGYGEGMVYLGRMLKKGQGMPRDRARAVFWFERAAKKGHADGWVQLGVLHEFGETPDGKVDMKRAVELYRRAANAGDRGGMTNLGVMLRFGRGVKTDKPAAFKLFLQASKMGNARAMALAAECYLGGEGVKADPRKARSWAERGAELGNDAAKEVLRKLLEPGPD